MIRWNEVELMATLQDLRWGKVGGGGTVIIERFTKSFLIQILFKFEPDSQGREVHIYI